MILFKGPTFVLLAVSICTVLLFEGPSVTQGLVLSPPLRTNRCKGANQRQIGTSFIVQNFEGVNCLSITQKGMNGLQVSPCIVSFSKRLNIIQKTKYSLRTTEAFKFTTLRLTKLTHHHHINSTQFYHPLTATILHEFTVSLFMGAALKSLKL